MACTQAGVVYGQGVRWPRLALAGLLLRMAWLMAAAADP
jgi:hypothetical protein